MTEYRREEAYQVRLTAAAKAKDREHPRHQGNGDEQRYATANYAMSFTKGLRHSATTGLIVDKEDFERLSPGYRRGIYRRVYGPSPRITRQSSGLGSAYRRCRL